VHAGDDGDDRSGPGRRADGQDAVCVPILAAVLEGPGHVVKVANEPYLEALGVRDCGYGMSMRELMPELRNQRFLDVLDEVYRLGEPRVLVGQRVSVDPAGGGARQERVYNVCYDPSRDAEGRVCGVIVTATDVSGVRRAEQLAEGQRRLLEQIAVEAPLSLVLDGIACLVEELLPGTRCMIMMADAEGRRLAPIAAPSLPDFLLQAAQRAADHRLARRGTAQHDRRPTRLRADTHQRRRTGHRGAGPHRTGRRRAVPAALDQRGTPATAADHL
jgi:hypothetical protein